MGYCIGIDLGGTNIAVGVVDSSYKICGRASTPTNAPRPAAEIVEDIYLTAQKAAQDAGISLDEVEWIGAGTPGTVNPETGVVGLAANLDFHNTPLGKLLAERFGQRVFLENDANAAAYGEALAGAAAGMSSVVMVTIGTGIGGGIIIDGKIQSGFNHKGAELGHMGMVYQGVPCTCGRIGCIEAYCSATGLIRITREAMEQHKDSKMWEWCGSDLARASGRTAFESMRAGDEASRAVVEQYIEYFAYALSGIINLLMPEILVIGGGVSKEGEFLLVPLRERTYAQTFNHEPDNCTRIVKATLGNDAGIIGAAFLGKQNRG